MCSDDHKCLNIKFSSLPFCLKETWCPRWSICRPQPQRRWCWRCLCCRHGYEVQKSEILSKCMHPIKVWFNVWCLMMFTKVSSDAIIDFDMKGILDIPVTSLFIFNKLLVICFWQTSDVLCWIWICYWQIVMKIYIYENG